ncbi:MAG: hypothetical protein A2086_03300 [Spirochaetes bacterium GWD1_27_9]|nr:MAG: hypothetical protein A2Z98_12530 [Spirochaetes bacterium GWB1_27_13]OHD45275.1 MAG: hypothetical protein A2086_03300 [Spirochaetes bacterium GWD1_27_9]
MFYKVASETVIAQQDISESIFFTVDGKIATNDTQVFGVSEYGGTKDFATDAIYMGIVEVLVEDGEEILVGDRISTSLNGKAKKNNADGKFLARTGGQAPCKIEVVLR